MRKSDLWFECFLEFSTTLSLYSQPSSWLGMTWLMTGYWNWIGETPTWRCMSLANTIWSMSSYLLSCLFEWYMFWAPPLPQIFFKVSVPSEKGRELPCLFISPSQIHKLSFVDFFITINILFNNLSQITFFLSLQL